mgnify:CR=1 FL=1
MRPIQQHFTQKKDVTIAGDGLQKLDFYSALTSFEVTPSMKQDLDLQGLTCLVAFNGTEVLKPGPQGDKIENNNCTFNHTN